MSRRRSPIAALLGAPQKSDTSELDLEQELLEAFADETGGPLDLDTLYRGQPFPFKPSAIVSGRVTGILGDAVLIDIGYKSEGIIPLREWSDEGLGDLPPPSIGDRIEVHLGEEDASGAAVLSFRKARWQRAWEAVLSRCQEGTVVTGTVRRKCKGGLLVDIGVNAFLPSSQVDVRRPRDLGEYVGQTVECTVLRIDEERRNIVLSRRKLLEHWTDQRTKELMAQLEPGQVRRGVVKNIVDFGAFVDLGGMDALLHISDMAWHRVRDPRDVVHIDQELEVQVLRVDREREKVALSLKHLTPSPWAGAAQKYPAGSRHKGEVVNVLPYGAFVKLEPGVEGLVHISEMSWTRRINHPSDLVHIGDVIDVRVLTVNLAKQEISLGMKQALPDPWDGVAQRYRLGEVRRGKVTKLTNFGAFVELEPGLEGLVHISELADGKVVRTEDVVAAGDEVEVKVLRVDVAGRKIGLSCKGVSGTPTRELRGGTNSTGGSMAGRPGPWPVE